MVEISGKLRERLNKRSRVARLVGEGGLVKRVKF